MSRRRTTSPADSLPFDTLTLEGGLFVPELLEKAARGDAALQTEDDYGVPKGLKLQEEYGRAYRIAAALWQGFAAQLVRKDLPAHEATSAFVLALLRDALGYPNLALVEAPLQPTAGSERHFPISALALGGRVPIVIAPHDLGLDDPDPQFAIRGGGTRRKSPFQLTQEYLNAAPNALWGLCTNGRAIRLVRDADTLTRPAYLEFDLATILREGEDRYADFAALWRLLHGSRAGGAKSLPADCAWEKWKTEGHSLGLRVRDGLRNGVTEALLILGNGFLAHRDNTALRERLGDGNLSKDAYFQQLLRLVYRHLFLFCAEERTDPSSGIPLLHSLDSSPVARDHYARGYSLRRLRTRCLRRAARDSHGDLWQSVSLVFRALATGEPRLALPALGGLFAPDQCPDLDGAALANADLLAAMRQLRWSSQSGRLTSIDYRNMGPEELGSVYESLLELIPSVDIATRRFGFVGITDSDSSAGNARKLTGSYYTPDSLVQELIKSALDPVIARKVADHPEDPTAAILSLSVIDPACGSGHFLISAARRLAEKLAELRAPDGAVRPGDYRHALREVISHCIYGVDRNPMALELARTALWLEGYEPGQPLSFLDHHLQCGDALLGLTSFEQLRKGIAKDAFTVLSGDDKTVCKNLAAINREALKSLEKRLKDKSAELFDADDLHDSLQRLEGIEAMPDDSTAEVEAKKTAFARFLDEARTSRLAHACDLLVAAYLTPKTPDTAPLCPTTATLLDVLFPQQGKAAPRAVIDHAGERCREARVFHWPLRFAHIFGHGGFDCVLGNPPWERIKLQEEEFFASREPLIAAAKNKAERAKRIQWLSEGSLHYHLSQFTSAPPPDRGEVALFREFVNEKRLAEATSAFAHVNGEDGGRFPLTGVGDVNTYALFAETISQITSRTGRAGFIVPTGIATDDSTKAFFSHIVDSRSIVSLFDFVNTLGFFPNVESQLKFCLVTLGASPTAEFAAFLKKAEFLADPKYRFILSAEDFRLINPNTRTCPIFRSEADAELTKKIYRRVPVLIREARVGDPEKNPWDISFSRMLDMAVDSHLFLDKSDPASLPLYEAKMMHQFDHRWATYTRDGADEITTADVTDEQKEDTSFHLTPRYWVPERDVLAKIARSPKCVRDAFRDQNADALLAALAIWIEARHEPDLLGGMTRTTARQRVLELGGHKFDALPTKEKDWLNDKALSEARDWPPLTEDELDIISSYSDLAAATHQLLNLRSPRWLMGWRDITKAANERTVIASVVPRVGCGDTLLLMFPKCADPRQYACLLADQNSLVHDFIARQKIGGTHLKYHVKKQITTLPPSAYTEADLAFIVPRVLELTYTADDLSGWARDLGHDGPPFRFDPDRRALLRAELDAWYARLYGLTREELQYILDPATTHGPDYPTVTFPGLKKNEIAKYGEYRTQRLVLEAWDRTVENSLQTTCQNSPQFGSWRGGKEKLPLRYFSLPEEKPETLRGKPAEDHFYARVSQAEEVNYQTSDRPSFFWKLEAFSKTWFDSNPPPKSNPTWQDQDSFINYYSRAEIFMLELEVIPRHLESFNAFRIIQNAVSEDADPTEWFLVRAGGERKDRPIDEVVPLSVFPSLYQAGASLTLDGIEPVDPKTQELLNQAVSTGHIADAEEKDLERILGGALENEIEWSVVYDVGQGSCIGMCDMSGGVRAYFDFGGGILQNLKTFPAPLQSFCFTKNPPIILSHWDEDHWSSANRDTRALSANWIVPRQPLTPGPAALLASIAKAGGRVWFLPSSFSGRSFSQIFLELCTGSNRNNSGIALTLTKWLDGCQKKILMPGDADYRHVGSISSGSPYLSIVASHHGGALKITTTIPRNPGDQASRLVYSAGPNNSYGHPLLASRQAHNAAGWQDPAVGQTNPGDVRETENRDPASGLGHLCLGWQGPVTLPPLPCGGNQCQLKSQQT